MICRFDMKRPEKGLVVDGSTRGNPGPSEYQIYDLEKKQIIFKSGWLEDVCTNNVCEFLALATGVYLNNKNGLSTPVYSDSQTAIAWVSKKYLNSPNNKLKHRTDKAIEYLRSVDVNVEKWHTSMWGENPADFGLK